MVGSGSFGHVYQCTHVKTGEKFALKNFKKRFTSQKEAYALREIKLLKRMDEKAREGIICPYVLGSERIEYENRKLYVVFQMMENNLSDWIKRKGKKGMVRLDEDAEIKVIMG